jgi:hypothetical protein
MPSKVVDIHKIGGFVKPVVLRARRGARLGGLAALLLTTVAIPVLAQSPAAAAGPAPANLDTAGTFLDTFAAVADTQPLYGLNVSLDSRQTGTAKASYTRLSGLWNSGHAPAPVYVQVNDPQHPNQLLFSSGISAIMLDAPAVADASGHYTVSTTVDPVVGDTASGDWGSLMLARSRNSAGYVTNADIDLGLTVGSNGHLDLFHAGQGFWSSAVPAAGAYAVSVTVSTGADRSMVLVVNGTTFTVTAPAGVGRWPSTPYLRPTCRPPPTRSGRTSPACR